jgi:pimeloyl-ACP methyl ester carboxylesterase
MTELQKTPHLSQPAPRIQNVVLVHGAFGDGSNWKLVIPLLLEHGFRVMAVQNPLTSLAADVEATRRILDKQDGPTLLVGHSWGGAVITEAGVHPKVVGLVYVAAYTPNSGESANDSSAPYGVTEGQKQIAVDADGYALLTKEGVERFVAEGLSSAERELMLATQALTYGPIFNEKLTQAAWETRSVAHVIATSDQTLAVALQEADARKTGGQVTRVPTCHMLPLQAPDEVAAAVIALSAAVLR